MSNLHHIGQLSLDSFNHQVIQATIDKCSQTHNPRILETIKQNWISNLNKRLNAFNENHTSPKRVLKEDLQNPATSTTAKTQEALISDDEFVDADVESVHPADVKLQIVEVDNLGTEQPVKEETTKEDNSDASLSDISDLDDEEPESTDMVIGMLEKITRPSSKKFGPPLWRVRLKYGIMQINNTEIPFDTLDGEFEF